jgi:signal transduction histidine kinase/ActR/RegA family two-component response regulator
MTRLPAPSDRAAAQREGLLRLARLLVGAHHGGTLSESLEVVASSLGVEACAAYEEDRDALVLVTHRGLSPEMRAALERLERSEEPWFIAARAWKSRRIVVEADVAAATTGAAAAACFPAGARLSGAAVPLVSGREVLGVLVLLCRRSDTFDAAACGFLETAAGLVTLARKAEGPETPAASRREEAQMGPLAMAGMLAAHFADDVRGPLAGIGLVLREEERVLAKIRTPDDEAAASLRQLRQLIQEAQLAVNRAQAVTAQIAGAAQASKKEPLVFADVLKEAIAMTEPAASVRGVVLVRQLHGDDRVLGRRPELVPAFVAMITNAIQACVDGPRTRRPTVKITMEDDPRGVAVCIEDSGAGVPADVRSRIFDPFFSTHEGAAGIGLTLAKHAIIGSSGHIEISLSAALGGALFRAVLPRASGARKDRRTSLSSATLRRVTPGPSIVWIDRDEVFVAGARRALDTLDVRTAASVADGERLLLGERPPELVFCELDLPDGSGLDLHAQVAKQSPELAARFVFVSDGVLSPERAAYVLASGCPTILKPIDLDDIRTLVHGAGTERTEPSARVTAKMPAAVIDDPFDLDG